MDYREIYKYERYKSAHEMQQRISKAGQRKFEKRISNGESATLPLHTLIGNKNSQYSKLRDLDRPVQGCQKSNLTSGMHRQVHVNMKWLKHANTGDD